MWPGGEAVPGVSETVPGSQGASSEREQPPRAQGAVLVQIMHVDQRDLAGPARLESLLISLFDAPALRRFLARQDPAIHNDLPESASLAELCFQAVEHIRRRGLRRDLFRALVAEFPNRQEDVEGVEFALLGPVVAPAAPYLGEAAATRIVGLIRRRANSPRLVADLARDIGVEGTFDDSVALVGALDSALARRLLEAFGARWPEFGGEVDRQLGDLRGGEAAEHYESAATAQVVGEREELRARLRTERWMEAEELARSLLSTALLHVAALPDPWRGLSAALRLDLASSLMAQQRVEEASRELAKVAGEALTEDDRLRLARLLLQLDELDRAESLARGDEGEVIRIAIALRRGVGVLPIGSGDLWLELEAARAALMSGDAQGAARRARAAQPRCERTLDRLMVLDLAVSALRDTVMGEIPPPRPVVIEERGELVELIEGLLLEQSQLEGLAPTLALRHWETSITWYQVCADGERITHAMESAPAGSTPAEGPTPFELATEGRLEEALASIGSVEPPWRARLVPAWLRGLSGAREAAIVELEELARAYADRPALSLALSQLLLLEGELERALEHAEQAYRLLPAGGYRRQLGLCLARQGSHLRAWELLHADAASADPRVRFAVARCAMELSRPEAEVLWRGFIHDFPWEARGRFSLAVLLSGQGRHEEAAKAAWEAFRAETGERLSADEIAWIGGALARSGHVDEEAITRIEAVSRRLHDRFGGEPEAEAARLWLSVFISDPSVVPPADTRSAIESGIVHAIPLDEIVERERKWRSIANMALQLYSAGRIGFQHLGWALGKQSAELLLGLTRLVTPVHPKATDFAQLRDATILLGELELCLLGRLNVLDRLGPAAEERCCTFLLFHEDRERIRKAPTRWAGRPHRLHLERARDLLKALRLSDEVEFVGGSGEEPDEQLLARADRGVIDHEATSDAIWISPERLAAWLVERSYLRPEHRGRLRNLDGGGSFGVRDPMPRELVVSWVSLQHLWAFGWLDALLLAAKSERFRLLVGPRARRIQEDRIEELERAVAAEDLSLAVAAWVDALEASGRLATTVKPDPGDLLPAPREEAGDGALEVYREAFSRWRVLLDRPELRLLVADAFLSVPSLGLFPPELEVAFAWTPEARTHTRELVQGGMQREILLPSVVLALTDGPTQVAAMRNLAHWGFADALTAEGLLNAFEGLGRTFDPGGRLASILDAADWAAGSSYRFSPFARLEWAERGADALWEAWVRRSWEEEDREAFTNGLLDRGRFLDQAKPRDLSVLDLLMTRLFTLGILRFGEIHQDIRTRGVLDEETPVSRMWKGVRRWQGREWGRGGAVERGLLEGMTMIPSQGKEFGLSLILPLVLHGEAEPIRWFARPSQAGMAILSATWTHSPLDLEGATIALPDGRTWQIFQQRGMEAAVSAMDPSGKAPTIDRDLQLSVLIPLGDTGNNVRALVPIEAALLRAPPEWIQSRASELAGPYACLDGRVAGLLRQLAEDPGAGGVREKAAQAAALAPWRVVRAEPAWIARWSPELPIGGGAPRSIADLRALLSEPGPLPPGPGEELWREALLEHLHQALSPPGAAIYLLPQFRQIPGELARIDLEARLSADRVDDEVREATARIEHPDDQPATRLASDTLLLLLAARPTKDAARTPTSLDHLPTLLADLLDRLSQPDPEEAVGLRVETGEASLAGSESATLRLCAEVVLRLGGAELPQVDHIWLTWRLFGWLVLQVDATGPAATGLAWKELGRIAPPPRPDEASQLTAADLDLLQPLWWTRERFDHRLALLLGSMNLARLLLSQSQAPTEEQGVSWTFSSSEPLEEHLARLAVRPLSAWEARFQAMGDGPSALPWPGPSAIPDLALLLLLSLDVNGLARLPAPPDQDGAVPEGLSLGRLRWIERLKDHRAGRVKLAPELETRLWLALYPVTSELHPLEREIVEALVRDPTPDPNHDALRLVILLELAAPGRPELLAEARARILTGGTPLEALLAGELLMADAAAEPDALPVDLSALESLVRGGQLAPVELAAAVARVAVTGPEPERERAAAALLDLAGQPGFREDEAVQGLVRQLGLQGPRKTS